MWKCAVYPQLWSFLGVLTYMPKLWAAIQMGCAQGRLSGIELGYTVWCYTMGWLNVNSAPEGSGIECNTSIMGLCLECTTPIRCDIGRVFLLRWGCLHKNRNKNCQFLLVCKLGFTNVYFVVVALVPVLSHVIISYWIKHITVASLNFLSLLLYVACSFLFERRLCHRCSV